MADIEYTTKELASSRQVLFEKLYYCTFYVTIKDFYCKARITKNREEWWFWYSEYSIKNNFSRYNTKSVFGQKIKVRKVSEYDRDNFLYGLDAYEASELYLVVDGIYEGNIIAKEHCK